MVQQAAANSWLTADCWHMFFTQVGALQRRSVLGFFKGRQDRIIADAEGCWLLIMGWMLRGLSPIFQPVVGQ